MNDSSCRRLLSTPNRWLYILHLYLDNLVYVVQHNVMTQIPEKPEIEMQLLRCPKINEEKFFYYTQKSQKARTYSNFGPCEALLKSRLANLLGVEVSCTTLGSSATSLLQIACELCCGDSESRSADITGYFPNFSFFSTFSVAHLSRAKIKWYDLTLGTYMPAVADLPHNPKFIYLTVPFGSERILEYFQFAKSTDSYVIIDAAACLPTIIHKKIKLTQIPKNVIIVFSLHATKLINSGEGGLMVFGQEIPQHAQNLTNFGFNHQRIQFWPRAYNAKMSEFNAAAGLTSLDDSTSNISKILSAKKKAEQIGLSYGIKFFTDVASPTLTLHVLAENASQIMKETPTKFPLRQWWGLNKQEPEKFPVSQKLYDSLLGVPFDWECVDDYFPTLCEYLSQK